MTLILPNQTHHSHSPTTPVERDPANPRERPFSRVAGAIWSNVALYLVFRI